MEHQWKLHRKLKTSRIESDSLRPLMMNTIANEPHTLNNSSPFFIKPVPPAQSSRLSSRMPLLSNEIVQNYRPIQSFKQWQKRRRLVAAKTRTLESLICLRITIQQRLKAHRSIHTQVLP